MAADFSEDCVGALDVCIHQARDIHNICIYQNQDVYAKIYLTSNPEKSVSTKTIDGGGRNPIFNENLRVNVLTLDSSLKCEIWMLSKIRNYLEDQLLGFALVPVSDILLHNGKLEKEFSLSSSSLFHSPAGYVQLSISYVGTPPEVFPIPAPQTTHVETVPAIHDRESSDPLCTSICDELHKIEFPDPKVVSETRRMVEEYIKMPCVDAEPLSLHDLVQHEESFSTDSESSMEHLKNDSPLSTESMHATSSATVPASFGSSKTAKNSKETNFDEVSGTTCGKPVVRENVEPELKLVQEEIVDMYMKSMQQFTESLAKMKMDFDSVPTISDNSSLDQKPQAASKNSSSRVFYGSRAFF